MTSIANLIADKRTITIRMNGDSFTITYRPNRVTMAEQALIQEISESGDPLALAKRLCRWVSDWTIEGPFSAEVRVEREDNPDDDEPYEIETVERELVQAGEKIPLEPAIIQYLGNEIILAIIYRIQEDASPNPTSRKSTPNKSRQRG